MGRMIVRNPNLEVATKTLLHEQGKNIGVVFVPCSRMEVRPTAISSGVHISEDPGCHLLRQVSSQ